MEKPNPHLADHRHPHRYHIKIDRENYVVDDPLPTGRELLLLAAKSPPEQWAIYKRLRKGQPLPIGLDEQTDLREPGVERFLTLPLDQTEGLRSRRHFKMPAEDEEFLTSLGLDWEAVVESNVRRLVVYGYPIVPGYNLQHADLYVRIDTGYADAELNMVYFHPALVRADRKSIRALAEEKFDGKTWQRWSRHRTRQNPWRPGIDNLSTHLALVSEWLRKEILKG